MPGLPPRTLAAAAAAAPLFGGDGRARPGRVARRAGTGPPLTRPLGGHPPAGGRSGARERVDRWAGRGSEPPVRYRVRGQRGPGARCPARGSAMDGWMDGWMVIVARGAGKRARTRGTRGGCARARPARGRLSGGGSSAGGGKWPVDAMRRAASDLAAELLWGSRLLFRQGAADCSSDASAIIQRARLSLRGLCYETRSDALVSRLRRHEGFRTLKGSAFEAANSAERGSNHRLLSVPPDQPRACSSSWRTPWSPRRSVCRELQAGAPSADRGSVLGAASFSGAMSCRGISFWTRPSPQESEDGTAATMTTSSTSIDGQRTDGVQAQTVEQVPPTSTNPAGEGGVVLDPNSLKDVNSTSLVGSSSMDTEDVLQQVATASADSWTMTKIPMYGLTYLHEMTGLPWWSTIAVATVLFRFVMFPFMIMQLKNTHALTVARPEIDQASQTYMTKRQTQGLTKAQDLELQMEYRNQVQSIFAKHKCSPLASLIPVAIQLPVFLSFYWALRQMAEGMPSLADGGEDRWAIRMRRLVRPD
eukprot:scaffold412_cov388-Prasinococcus_capsulatus_cf.AAC.26